MVYVLLADGFEEIEAITPVDMLRRAGIEVVVVGVTGLAVTGAHGVTVSADTTITEARFVNGLEMVVLPGGGVGTENLASSADVAELLRSAYEAGCYLSAICAAPSVLGKYGYLRGREAVCFPGFESRLEGARISSGRVVVDERVITAKGAGCAVEFAAALIAVLRGQATADRVTEAMFV